jgi:hypothetical protein
VANVQVASVTVTGHDDLIRLMVLAGQSTTPILGQALKEGGDDMMRESQEQVPFRDGPLKNSGRVTGPAMLGPDVVVMLSYGNTAVAYALYQHEGKRQDGTRRIRQYHNGKKGHYLSDPVNDMAPTLGPSIALRLEELLRRGR